MLWLLERNVYGSKHPLENAILDFGSKFLYIEDGKVPNEEMPCIFHGSLNVAAKLANSKLSPGAICNILDHTQENLLSQLGHLAINNGCAYTTVGKLISDVDRFKDEFKCESIFVRPNGPLKEFSGRVVSLNNLSLACLDFGYYFDDLNTRIIVSRVQDILYETRYIIVDNKIITRSGYDASTRSKRKVSSLDEIEFAKKVIERIKLNDEVYVLDIAETTEGTKVVETNPFSGSSLYDCELNKIVEAIEAYYCTAKD